MTRSDSPRGSSGGRGAVNPSSFNGTGSMAARRDTCHKVLTVCSFQRDGWAHAAAGGWMTFCVALGGNLLWLGSSCLLRLSA